MKKKNYKNMKIFTDMEYKTSPQSSCSPDWSTMFRESCNCRSLKLNSMFYGQWGLSVKCALPGFDYLNLTPHTIMGIICKMHSRDLTIWIWRLREWGLSGAQYNV